IGIAFGLYMSIFHVFNLATVHVHMNLLGWMSLAIAGIFYHLYPNLAKTASAKIHFWLHNIGLPIMMICIAVAILGGGAIFFPFAPMGRALLEVGIFCCGYTVLRRLWGVTFTIVSKNAYQHELCYDL